MDRNKVKAVFVLGILVSILVACGGESGYVPSSPVVPTLSTDNSPTGIVALPSNNLITTGTPIAIATIAPSTATHMAWYTTALAYQRTEAADRQNFWNSEATQRAQFLVSCDDTDLDAYDYQVSTNGEWIAVSCGNKERQKLIVQNKEGEKWIVKPEDVFSPDGYSGGLSPVFWDIEEGYLYIGRTLGYSGGGDHCFPSAEYYIGYYGYFRLNLNDGSWTTILPQTDRFPGYDMQFSPSGRRYAVDIDGITIADFKTGEVVKFDADGVVDFGWSPDSRYLAYFVATCDESGWVKSGSVYAWDSKTNQVQLLFTAEKLILYLESWVDDSTLRMVGRKVVENNYMYDVYVYDISTRTFILSGTATPSP